MGQHIDLLLKRHEDKTLEFKRDLSSPDRVIATLVAFANSAGGVVVLGVADGTRAVVGVGDPTAVEERLSNLVADRIAPSLLVEVSVVPWRGRYVVMAEVFPSARRPHHVRQLGQEGGTYVRIGSSNRLADESLRAELARGMSPTFDETALPDAKVHELDEVYAASVLRRDAPLTVQQMMSLHAIERSGKATHPTVGGYLLFRKDLEPHRMPDAWVQCGRFSGTDRSTIADSRRIDGRLVELVDRTMEYLDRALDSARVISGRSTAHDIVRPVPIVALREAVVNAVVHADYRQQGGPIRIAVYGDRIEIESPGLLLPGLTVDDLFDGVSRLRNRMIGRVFAERGYIEQWGSGVRRMTTLCAEAGLPRPSIEERPGRVRVTFRMDNTGEVQLKPREHQALAAIDSTYGTSANELATRLGVTDRTARTLLAAMLSKGVVLVVGSSPNDPNRRFYRTHKATQPRP
jgi:ATP-dependent DNA helicase RecG